MKINKFIITMFTAFAGMYSAEMPEYTGGTGRSSTEYGRESPGIVFISSAGSPVSYRAFAEILRYQLTVYIDAQGNGVTPQEFAEEQHLTPEEFAEELTRRLEVVAGERGIAAVRRRNIRMGIIAALAGTVTIASLLLLLNGPLTT